eukprot:c29701_g1_i1 orf=187-435(+)
MVCGGSAIWLMLEMTIMVCKKHDAVTCLGMCISCLGYGGLIIRCRLPLAPQKGFSFVLEWRLGRDIFTHIKVEITGMSVPTE